MTAGEKAIDKREWDLIEMTMLKGGFRQPPKNAPAEYQLNYLEKIDEIRRLERLPEEDLIKYEKQRMLKEYFDKQKMSLEDLQNRDDLNVDDADRIQREL